MNKECLVVGSQECLLSSSDEENEGLEKFLRDKLESFCGEGIENIVEIDPAGVFELLDENLLDRGNTGGGVVTVDDKIPRSRLDDILRWELREKTFVGGSKRPLCDVDIGMADERPSKSVAFDIDVAWMVDCFLKDVLWLRKMLVSHSQVVPDRMTQFMVHLSWSRLHAGELAM